MSKEWSWQGYSGHFVGADKCLFRLCTAVGGGYIVSTVGHYMSQGKVENIGSGSTFETYVFEAELCDCGCGEIRTKGGNELDGIEANDPIIARRNHLMMCKKWDHKEKNR